MKRRKRAVVTTLLFSILLTVIPVGDNGQSMMQQCAAADTVTGQKSVSACEYLNDTTALAGIRLRFRMRMICVPLRRYYRRDQ